MAALGTGDSTVEARGSFRRRLVLIALGGMVLRVAFVLWQAGDLYANDGYYYHDTARMIVDGEGFQSPYGGGPVGYHPPFWPLLLSLPTLLGLDSGLEHQLFACLVGTAAIVLVGLAGREVVNERVGLLSAGLVAIYPNLWVHERELFSEVALAPLVAAAILLAYRHLDRPRTASAVLLGVVCGALVLTRAEQVLLLVLLVAPVILLAGRERSMSLVRVRRLLAAGLAAALVVTPWAVYNNLRFEEPVLLTTSFGITARIANCEGAYETEMLGYVDERCYYLPAPAGDQSVKDPAYRQDALEFALDNAERLPAVLLARQGRTWSLYRPFQQAELDAAMGRSDRWVYVAGLFAYWFLVGGAIVGVVALRRRGRRSWPLLSFAAVVVVATTLTYGQPRFRVPAEVPLVVLAATGVDELWRRRAARVPGGIDVEMPSATGDQVGRGRRPRSPVFA